MGLLKARADAQAELPACSAGLSSLLADLAAPEASSRRVAARALGAYPDAITDLIAALGHEGERPVQQALIGAMTEIASTEAVSALVGLLRAEDATLRNLSLEALQTIGPAALAPVHALLNDPDGRERISAVVTLAGLPSAETEAWLLALMDRETESNVLAAIIEALHQIGSPAALPALDRLAARGSIDPFLAFALTTVRARLVGNAG